MRFQITGVKLPGHRPVTITINADDEAEARELAACNEIEVRSVGPAPGAARAVAAVAEAPAVARSVRVHRSRVAEFLPRAEAKKCHRVQRGWLVLIAGVAAAAVAAIVAAAVWIA